MRYHLLNSKKTRFLTMLVSSRRPFRPQSCRVMKRANIQPSLRLLIPEQTSLNLPPLPAQLPSTTSSVTLNSSPPQFIGLSLMVAPYVPCPLPLATSFSGIGDPTPAPPAPRSGVRSPGTVSRRSRSTILCVMRQN